MKILVTGASGMLAADVIPELLKEGHSVVQTDIRKHSKDINILDISSYDETIKNIKDTQPEYVFHFAAETDVDLCEKNPQYAHKVNVLGTENIVLACREVGAGLLYVSTANVFNGEKSEPYVESDEAGSINVYGRSKYQGELIVKKHLCRYFIIRAGWMVGGWELDKKFVYKIIQQLKQGKKNIKAVFDKAGSLTFTKDFAVNFMDVINTQHYGLYHMANKGVCSRYDIAVKIVEFMDLKNKVKVFPVESKEFPLPAPRPRSEMLSNHNLELLGLNNMPFWESSLKEYIKINKDK
ncbi:MAG: dTDP-4-dehydrorhamnose reductase [Candidatus Omnitrophica bacterium]|nr:dTDP-4-dehydrorhamnose reductase [Candidatus Omnitrophota bacterium]MDD5429409.1 dTDP-4-dehydrorhamnose reductase [Candidatus Omnitrophota bacterium]